MAITPEEAEAVVAAPVENNVTRPARTRSRVLRQILRVNPDIFFRSFTMPIVTSGFLITKRLQFVSSCSGSRCGAKSGIGPGISRIKLFVKSRSTPDDFLNA
jgi:hypothetical protein